MSACSTVTAYLKHLAEVHADKFPGSETEATKNAAVYVDGLSLLRRTCEPLYDNSAQAALMKDVSSLVQKLSESKEDIYEAGLHTLLLQKLRFLNGHGVKHLHAVDTRALQLVEQCEIQLTPYEVFFLAASLAIHDAGLIFGRDGHESSIHQILATLSDSFVKKRERDVIERIAGAHSGYVRGNPGNKDTIGELAAIEQVQGLEIRPQLIASIVRLADELAEDHTRYVQVPGQTAAERRETLMGSEVFHIYSRCLEPCLIKGKERTINLQFLLNIADVLQTFLKGSEEVYLLDEIYSRTEKCFAELIYCGRFIQDSTVRESVLLPPNELRVEIHIASDDHDFEPLTLRYTIKSRGYPQVEAFGHKSFEGELTSTIKEYAERNGISSELVTDVLRDSPKGLAVAKLFGNPSSAGQASNKVVATADPKTKSRSIMDYIKDALGIKT